MKMKLQYTGLTILAALTLFSCDDTTGSLGMDMMQPTDAVVTADKEYNVITQSVLADSIYAKTSTGYIGRFTDPLFGPMESSFLTEFNCLGNYSLFPDLYKESEDGKTATGIMVEDKFEAVSLYIEYTNWFGDSLNACRMSAYELMKPLENKNRYTDIDPESYLTNDTQIKPKLLGRVAYSAYDTSVPDSVRNATDSSGNPSYYPYFLLPLDEDEFTTRFLKAYRTDKDLFKDNDTFRDKVFKGIYLKSDYGDGTVIYVDRVNILASIKVYAVDSTTGLKLKKSDGTDSTYTSVRHVFSATKEVFQVNNISNSTIDNNFIEELQDKDYTYIKSPAGLLTEITLPIKEIENELGNDTINGIKLQLNHYKEETKPFSMSIPTYLLMVRSGERVRFFENNEVPDNITSYIVSHTTNSTNYTFSNIARIVTTIISERKAAKLKAEKEGHVWDETAWEAANPDWNKVTLVPVTVDFDSSTSNSIIKVTHDLKPGLLKLKGANATTSDEQKVKIDVTYTRFGLNAQ